MRWQSQLDRWRDEQHPIAKGCGCGCLAVVGLLSLAIGFGPMFGDYIGPPERLAEFNRNLYVGSQLGSAVLVLCAVVGRWLISDWPRKK